MTRKEACYYLGIREDAPEDQIKRAYRYKAKLYHPDVNPDMDTREYYINVQEAYKFLMNDQRDTASSDPNANVQTGPAMNGYPNMYYNSSCGSAVNSSDAKTVNVRPAKVYASTAAAKASYKRQKEKEREREKIQKWDEEYKSSKRRQQQTQLYGKEYTDMACGDDQAADRIRQGEQRSIAAKKAVSGFYETAGTR